MAARLFAAGIAAPREFKGHLQLGRQADNVRLGQAHERGKHFNPFRHAALGAVIEIMRKGDDYYDLYCEKTPQGYNDDSPMPDGWYCACVTETNDFGRKMCKAIFEPLGYKYSDSDL